MDYQQVRSDEWRQSYLNLGIGPERHDPPTMGDVILEVWHLDTESDTWHILRKFAGALARANEAAYTFIPDQAISGTKLGKDFIRDPGYTISTQTILGEPFEVDGEFLQYVVVNQGE